LTPADLQFDSRGLIPAIVQHHASGQILMLGFANREALEKTLETRRAWFFSRSRQQLWQKGETSGHFLELKGLRVDCDADAIIYLCQPIGPTCHTGKPSCFFECLGDVPIGETSGEAAAHLFATISSRQGADPETSYVAKLLAEGTDRIAKKIGEEATEVVIAAKNDSDMDLAHEVADLWFHTFVLLAQRGMSPEDVWAELRRRRRS
jgi:phosphoribosyl-AMP cyclohydrolase / phosphoribosyl-ATP pyrophosphohydrolase